MHYKRNPYGHQVVMALVYEKSYEHFKQQLNLLLQQLNEPLLKQVALVFSITRSAINMTSSQNGLRIKSFLLQYYNSHFAVQVASEGGLVGVSFICLCSTSHVWVHVWRLTHLLWCFIDKVHNHLHLFSLLFQLVVKKLNKLASLITYTFCLCFYSYHETLNNNMETISIQTPIHHPHYTPPRSHWLKTQTRECNSTPLCHI